MFNFSKKSRTYTLKDALSANHEAYIHRIPSGGNWEYFPTGNANFQFKRVKLFLYPDIENYDYDYGVKYITVKFELQINKKTKFDVYYKDTAEASSSWIKYGSFETDQTIISFASEALDRTPNPLEVDLDLMTEAVYAIRVVKTSTTITTQQIIDQYGQEIKQALLYREEYGTFLHSMLRGWIRGFAMTASQFTFKSSLIGGIVGLQIDGSYGEVSIATRTGTIGQSRMPGFSNLSRFYTYSGEKLIHAADKSKQTSSVCDGVRLRVTSPSLYNMGSNGKKTDATVVFHIFYQKLISPGTYGSWVQATYKKDGSQSTDFEIVGNSSSVNAYFTVMFPERGQYNVRIRRITEDSEDVKKQNETYLTALVEIESTDIAYINTALLGIMLKATDKISGGTPKMSVMISGVKLRDVRDVVTQGMMAPKKFVEHSTDSNGIRSIIGSNPANIVFDVMTSKRYGAGNFFGLSHIDMKSLVEFANYCDEIVPMKIGYNDVSVYDNTVKYCEGFYVKNGDSGYRCIKTYADDITPSSISLSNTSYWKPIVKVGDFFRDYHKRFEINIVLDTAYVLADLIKKLCETCRTIPYWKGAKLAFFIDRPAIPRQMFTMGNIVEDTFEETYIGGLNIANQIEATYLDEDYDYEKQNVVAVDIEREQEMDTISVSMQLYGLTNRYRVHREIMYCMRKAKAIRKSIKFACNMSGVLSDIGDVILFQHSTPLYGEGGHIVSVNGDQVKLDKPVECKAGVLYTLRIQRKNATDLSDQNSIFGKVTFVGDGQFRDTFTVSNISVGDVYAFGPNSIEAKPFRITSITRKSDRVEIAASEYNESVYDDSLGAQITTIHYSGLGNRSLEQNYVPHVSIINLSEQITDSGSGMVSSLVVDFEGVEIFNKSSELISLYEIYYRTQFSDWALAGTTQSTVFTIPGVEVGETYWVAVRPRTNAGRTSIFSNDWYIQDIYSIKIYGQVDAIFENGVYESGVFISPQKHAEIGSRLHTTLWLMEPNEVTFTFTDEEEVTP